MKLRSALFSSAILLAIAGLGCARSADDGPADEKTPTQHVWPAKDAGVHDASSVVDAGPPWSAFETSDGGTAGGGGTGGGGTGGGGTGGGGTGTGTNACGICDRRWQCDAADDSWASDGSSACVDSRTGTALNCDGSMQGGGTWSGDSSEIVLAFPNVGGGSFDVVCTPGT